MRIRTIAAALLLAAVLVGGAATQEGSAVPVRRWEAPLVLPTYGVGAPDPNPRFYAGRAYQGAQGRVYPYAMRDVLSDVRADRTYRAVYLENEFLTVCILPELGGRVFSAIDRTNGYDLLYHQHVVKPALIGLTGAWTSGGIEWNFPHHHRATSFLPVDWCGEDHPDGSRTVWVGETELRHRMKWIVGVTLRPGRACFEATVKLFNRTPLAHSFLWWANVAVHANPSYQVILPPRTRWATYHGKNQFVPWPICREVYRGVDYSAGVDLSWWRNHPSPISFFAWNTEDDFLAGYDHDRQAGLLHVADPQAVPGKKFWVWGPGPVGQVWDKLLTDADGPYLELMVGAYSDNQPDYSWLEPYEVKVLEHRWFPLRSLGGVKHANNEAALDLEIVRPGAVRAGLNAFARHPGAIVRLVRGDGVVFTRRTDIGPDQPFSAEIAVAPETRAEELRLSLQDATGRELIAYRPQPPGTTPRPDVAQPPLAPAKIATVDELLLAGQRLEQFHSPALDSEPYYDEALRRDPGDTATNVAVGIRLLRQCRFPEAEARFRAALARLAGNHTNPRSGEAGYLLGLALRFQGKNDAAYEAFGRAAWDQAFHAAACLQLAELDSERHDFAAALAHVDRALATNAWNTVALDLKTTLLRRQGRAAEAGALADQVLALDPLDFRAAYEQCLALAAAAGGSADDTAARKAADLRAALTARLRGEVQSYLELAHDYGHGGFLEEAIAVLEMAEEAGCRDPLLHYTLGHFHRRAGHAAAAARAFSRGRAASPVGCFPFRRESIAVLHDAVQHNPTDPRAPYYLGNLLYEHRPRDAMAAWEQAIALDARFATAHRNLGMALAQVDNDVARAVACLDRAVACDPEDPRLLLERDVLYESARVPAEKRLEALLAQQAVVARHNDAFSREIVLLTRLGRYDEAIAPLLNQRFRKWEGIDNIHTTYVDAHLLRGWQRLDAGKAREALADFEAALRYPENLEVAPPADGGRAGQCWFFSGLAHEAAGNRDEAQSFFEKAAAAAAGGAESALRYYQGRALEKRGRAAEGRALFEGLIASAGKRLAALETGEAVDYFAKFGQRRPVHEQQAHAHYLGGLGQLGLGRRDEARAAFDKALALDPDHVWARAERARLE
ncbi:MAG: DUF5107 domain-containing protein [Planctomycetes bacterium]|nr:DUF5107 domain-containing protein [Planctomycetota bacterium]